MQVVNTLASEFSTTFSEGVRRKIDWIVAGFIPARPDPDTP